jgi:hypothetical protein
MGNEVCISADKALHDMPKVELRNGNEILGMGGPWMGQLYVDGALVDEEAMAEPICDHLAQWCVYMAYRCPTRWRKDVRFWLHAYHLSTGSIVRYQSAFGMVVLIDVEPEAVVVKHAFHAHFEGDVMRLPLPRFGPTNRVAIPWETID